MKKNNIKQLKEIVSNEIFFDLSYQGVQAYNISANEYEVITGFWKCNGRYYFVDRNNNKYLASRYDRAEFIAGEMLEQKERENKMINDYIDSIEKSGEVKVVFELVYEYINTCEARGIDSGELVAEEEDAAGETYNVYRREAAKNEESNEGSENEENAAAREPSMFADILAKAENATAKIKTFFAILAKMEWYSFILLGPSLVMLGVVFNCVCMLASGACPDMGRAVEGIVLFGLLSFAFAFGGFVLASDGWDEAKKEILIYNK